MSKPVPALVATTGIAAIVAAYLWQQLHAERNVTAQLREQVAQLQLAQAQQPAERVVIREVEVQPKATDQAAAAAATTKPAAAAAASALTTLSFNSRDLMKDPEYREGMALSLRASIAQNYPDIAKELNLTPEQTEKLFDLLTRQTMDSMANPLPDGADETAMREAATARSRQQQTEMVALLGDSGYQQYQDYQQTRGARQQVTQLRSALSSTADPMSEYQQSQLTSVLVAEQKRQMEESRQQAMARPAGPTTPRDQLAMMEESLKRNEESNRRIQDAASGYLNPQQLDAFRKMQNQSLSMTRAMLRSQRAQQESQGQ